MFTRKPDKSTWALSADGCYCFYNLGTLSLPKNYTLYSQGASLVNGPSCIYTQPLINIYKTS